MRVGFTLVDVFTDVPFAGNQLCVVPEPPKDLDRVTMQVLAREIGFSETTYVTAVREDGYEVRIFTPVSELPFARHGIRPRGTRRRSPERRPDERGGRRSGRGRTGSGGRHDEAASAGVR
jgi:hypothetical protein